MSGFLLEDELVDPHAVVEPVRAHDGEQVPPHRAVGLVLLPRALEVRVDRVKVGAQRLGAALLERLHGRLAGHHRGGLVAAVVLAGRGALRRLELAGTRCTAAKVAEVEAALAERSTTVEIALRDSVVAEASN